MNELYHYGTPRHSGRYPWGSGDNPYQRGGWDLLTAQDELSKKGLTKQQIAKTLEFKSVNEMDRYAKIARFYKKSEERSKIRRLKADGLSNLEISRQTGVPESTIRNYLKEDYEIKTEKTAKLADYLASQLDEKPYLDIGRGVENQLSDDKELAKYLNLETRLNVTKDQKDNAITMLKDKGYKVHYLKIEQVTNPGQFTTFQVLTKGDVSWKEVMDNRDKIVSPEGSYFEDDGRTLSNILTPLSISSDRIKINYSDTSDGGEKDGVIEIRPGAKDLSLGGNTYAQVRIAVDGTHYLKGMAIYNPDLPKGVDVVFNTNKTSDVPKMKVLKEMNSDPENPFTAVIRQQTAVDENGKRYLTSAVNIVNTDDDWSNWSKTLSSQFLAKQDPSLAKRQLDIDYKRKKNDFDAIMSVPNPELRSKLLESFSSDCDSSAVHLKAADLPRQATQVILPISSLKNKEVYAPNFKTGEEVILIRYPHGGIFEIPRLRVNNNNPEAKKIIGQSSTAIGINSYVAQQLSGADFDGDTVVAIPTANLNIKTTDPIKELQEFDAKVEYRATEGMPKVGKGNFNKQKEMGKATNLIMDMHVKGAAVPSDELIRAVKYSQVIIDAEKHNLNWKQARQDFGIDQLERKYQEKIGKDGRVRYGGASTLITRASGEARVPERKSFTKIDPETGKLIYEETGNSYTTKTGKVHVVEEKSTNMAETDDAYTLSTGTKIENVYADYANKMKTLANEARKEQYKADHNGTRKNKSAEETYAAEVSSLKSKLNQALKNKPRERQAQAIADKIVADHDTSNMEKDDLKKFKSKVLARTREGVKSDTLRSSGSSRNIIITDREWEAMQAGALPSKLLKDIYDNTDLDILRERATPISKKGMTGNQKALAKMLLSSGYSQADVAEELGVSVSTLKKEGLL